MKLASHFLFFISLCSLVFSVKVKQGLVVPTSIKQSLQDIVEVQGCNANICFGIDGSGSVNKTEFQKAKDFVKDIVDIVGTDTDAEFAAVEFTRSNTRISSLTGDKEDFLKRLNDRSFEAGGLTSIGAGIVYCDFQLSRRKEEANKIVLLTDGRNTIGGDPARRANNFRNRNDPNSKISAVEVGPPSDKDTLEAITADPNLVFNVDQYVELSLAVDDLVQQICEFQI